MSAHGEKNHDMKRVVIGLQLGPICLVEEFRALLPVRYLINSDDSFFDRYTLITMGSTSAAAHATTRVAAAARTDRNFIIRGMELSEDSPQF